MDPNSPESKLLDFLDAQKWTPLQEGNALATALTLLVKRYTNDGSQEWTIDMTMKGKRSISKVEVICASPHEEN